jgi:beta-phosphoglucomutase-like phosphatase (HAD superfamily)
MLNQVDFVFFDIGGALGDRNAAGKFVAFTSSAGLLQSTRELGLRVGIITTLGPQISNAEALDMLKQSSQFLDAHGFVSDHDAGVSKPNPEIYRFASRRAGQSSVKKTINSSLLMRWCIRSVVQPRTRVAKPIDDTSWIRNSGL